MINRWQSNIRRARRLCLHCHHNDIAPRDNRIAFHVSKIKHTSTISDWERTRKTASKSCYLFYLFHFFFPFSIFFCFFLFHFLYFFPFPNGKYPYIWSHPMTVSKTCYWSIQKTPGPRVSQSIYWLLKRNIRNVQLLMILLTKRNVTNVNREFTEKLVLYHTKRNVANHMLIVILFRNLCSTASKCVDIMYKTISPRAAYTVRLEKIGKSARLCGFLCHDPLSVYEKIGNNTRLFLSWSPVCILYEKIGNSSGLFQSWFPPRVYEKIGNIIAQGYFSLDFPPRVHEEIGNNAGLFLSWFPVVYTRKS